MEQQNVAGEKLPGFRALVKESFLVYKAKWIVLLSLLSVAYIISFFGGTISAAIEHSISALPSKGFFITAMGLLFFLTIIAIVIINSWLQAGAIMVLKDRTETLDIRETMRRAKPYIVPYIWTTLLTMPILFLGWLLFAVPGIIFSVWFMFAEYIVITDNQKGIGAIAKSREYARGYFGKILLLMLIAGFLMLFVMSALEALSKNLPMGNIFYSIASILISPLALIYPYLIFDYIKKIKGDTAATPTASQKNFLATLAIMGTIVIAAIIGLLIYFAPQIKNQYEIEIKKYEAQTGNQLPPLMQSPI